MNNQLTANKRNSKLELTLNIDLAGEVNPSKLERLFTAVLELSESGYLLDEVFFSKDFFEDFENNLVFLKHDKLRSLLSKNSDANFAFYISANHLYLVPKLLEFLHQDLGYFTRRKLFFGLTVDLKLAAAANKELLTSLQRFKNFIVSDTKGDTTFAFYVSPEQNIFFQKNRESILNNLLSKLGDSFEILNVFFNLDTSGNFPKQINFWKNFIDENITQDNFKNFTFPMVLKQGKPSFGKIYLHYKKNKTYLSPLLYHPILISSPSFEISKLSSQNIVEKESELIKNQYRYVSDNSLECGECPYLIQCVGWRILSLMEEFKIKNCVLPPKTLKLLGLGQ